MKTTVQHPFPTQDALCTLIAAIPGVVYQFKVQSDGAWQFLYLSPEIETLYEVSSEAVYADPDALTRCILPEDRLKHHAAVEYASQTQTAWFHEYRIQTPTGQRKWVHAQATPHPQPDGSVLWYGILTDITEQKQTEAALRDREAQYRCLIEHLHAGVIVHAPDTRILLANTQAAQLLGLSLDQMRGKTAQDSIWSFVGEDEMPLPFDAYPVIQVRATGRPLRNLIAGINRFDTGDRIWALINAFPEWDIDGNLTQIVVILIDFTERKHQEEVLKLSAARYTAIVEGQTDLVCRYLPNGTLTFVNDAYCRYFDRSTADLLAHSFLHLMPDEDRAQVIAPLIQCDADHPVVINEHRVIRSDNTVRWVQWTNQAILDDGGTLIELQAVGRDITEQRQAEEALRESERFNTTILNSLNEGMVVLDAQGIIVKVNAAWERLAEDNNAPAKIRNPIGANYREVWFSVMGPSEPPSALIAWTGIEAVMTGVRDYFTVEYCNAAGKSQWFQMRAVPLTTLPRGVVIVHENITERKRLEVALQTMATTDDLTGLANRRHFLARLTEEQARLQRQGNQRAVVLM
ncbi:MAG: PAS domain S-box protein, partial [Candidatus Competibacteraceae bacterium]|nr:PAS domain S-box protein [Candidatus Competibacteraceae bacterium]